MSSVENFKLDEQLDKLGMSLKKLKDKLNDQESTADSINSTYRIIHNLKSSLFLFDYNDSLKLTYLMEQHFEKLRFGERALTLKALEIMGNCVIWIGNDIHELDNDELKHEVLIAGLKDLASPGSAAPALTGKLNLTSDEKALLRDARNSNLNIFLVEHMVNRNMSRDEYIGLPILKKINSLGMIALQTPAFVNLKKAERDEVPLRVVFVSDRKQKELTDPLLKNAVPFDEDLYMSHRDYKILIVEDNPVALMLQKSIMSDFGVCDTVNDGEAGLELFSLAIAEQSPYNIILLDLVMPGIDGTEVLKRIREQEGDNNIKGLNRCKVIVSTTTKESTVLMDLFRAEADAYIYKPLTKEKITKEMKNLKLL